MNDSGFQLMSNIFNIKGPANILAEAKNIVKSAISNFDFRLTDRTFSDITALFSGKYPGYRRCETEYHDLEHTYDCFMAMTRLLHGAHVSGTTISWKNWQLGMISALLHDAGYIQTHDDLDGTGAKYTATHIQRSIEFMSQYFDTIGLSRQDFTNCRNILKCTGLNVDTHSVHFSSSEIELLGQMLGTADLVGQMAARTYLEKLLFLYYEFAEAQIDCGSSELDLLRQTIDFHALVEARQKNELGNIIRFFPAHFHAHNNINKDLYKIAIEKNIAHLKHILTEYKDNHRLALRRGDIVSKLEKKSLSPRD